MRGIVTSTPFLITTVLLDVIILWLASLFLAGSGLFPILAAVGLFVVSPAVSYGIVKLYDEWTETPNPG